MIDLKINYIPTSELIPYANNAKVHDLSNIGKISNSIKESGFNNPVLMDGEKGIIAGHGRVLAAKHLDIEMVPTIELSHLSEVQKKAYILADNKLAEDSIWDQSILDLEIKDLFDSDFDISLAGFDENDFDFLKEKPGLTGEDEVPEAPEVPITKLCDLYILGEHRLLCGDSTDIKQVERLMDGQKADMVFTDPPYGVDYDGGHAVKGKRREKLANDATPDIYNNVMPVVYTISKDGAAVYLWFSDSKSAAVTAAVTAAGYQIRNTLIWNKNVAQFGAIGAQYKSKHEPCLYCFKKGKSPFWSGPNNEVSVWDIARCHKNEHHPTQKPTALAERAFSNSSKEEDIITDLFLGSGSTLIACEKTNRKCYGMELDPIYCDVIVKRWEDYTGKKSILKNND